MPGAVRSSTGHFAPHVALTLFLMPILLLAPTLFMTGAQPGLLLPTWQAGVMAIALMGLAWVTYASLRHYHDRHQCSRCDRNGMRDRYRLAPLGFLARHYHWCRTPPGLWVYLALWFPTVALSTVSTFGTVLLYAGMALWSASTIAHQARVRSCTEHDSTIMYDPTEKGFGAQRMLTELHYRARGAEHLHLQCERYACQAEVTVASPEEAVIWVMSHSDFHLLRSIKSPLVFVKVTLDPYLELEDVYV